MASRTLKPKIKARRWLFTTPRQTKDWGERFSRILKVGDVVALIGDLGAGKTTLAQGIAAGWGYKRGAISPTFALANEYAAPRGPVFHLDMYRLSPSDLASFPLPDYWEGGLCLIEWAERVRNRWPAGTLEIRLTSESPRVRRLEIINPSGSWRKRLAKISGD